MRAHLASLVDDFRRHGAGTFIVDHRGNRRYPATYGQLANLAGRFAAELERRRILPGERVVLWGRNSAEWIAAFFGCLLRGVLVVPLDAAGATAFAERVIRDVDARLVVGDLDLVRTVSVGAPQLLLSELTARLSAEPLFAVSDAVAASAPFQIVFTSGTTSEPKGIVHTHRNVLASLDPIEKEIAKYRRYERLVHPLRFLHSVPLSHVFGQFMGLWVPPLLAAELHFADHLEAARMIELIRRERISVLVAVPRVLELLRAHLLARFAGLDAELQRSNGLAVWKRWWRFRRVHRALGWKFWAAISGGASLPADVEGFWSGLGFALIQGYGMTETTALVTLNHPFHIGQGSLGKVLPGREVRISDDGEVLVRGPMLASATWQNGAIRPREDEWLATGDLAAQQASGELRFLGRKGDVIVTSAGMNVHPADLEAAMQQQPGVRACAIVPCQGATGAEPVAVVLFTGSEQDMFAAVTQANRVLAEYQKIRRVLRWPEPQFPYTSTGKLLRRKIAQWASATIAQQRGEVAEQDKDAPSSGKTDALSSLIASITGEPVAANADVQRLSEDFHLDSLGRVQLQSALEQQFALELDDDAMASVKTLGDLRALIATGSPGERFAVSNAETTPPAEKAAPQSEAYEQEAQSLGEAVAPPLEAHAHAHAVPPAGAASLEHRYPHWPWTWPVRALRISFLECVMRPLIWLLAAPQVVRPKELPQAPMLIIANHVTAYDGALILYALPGRLRRAVAIAMSGEMLLDFRRARNQSSALRNLLAPLAYLFVTALFNVFPLPRLRGFRRSFAHAGEAMDRGYSVMIFPEGTRSRDGNLQRFRPGIGLLAGESRVPVLPVALVGLGEMRTGKSRWFRSHTLQIRIGDAIHIDETTEPAAVTSELEQAVRRLLL